jgi:large subunit ribosomal protein L15
VFRRCVLLERATADGKETAMKLNQVADRPGARKTRQRIGRGIGSGVGKTGGRGGKGQTARSGVRIKGFEGGQMPLHRRLPKRGFNNVFAKTLHEVNLGRVQAAIDAGKLHLDASAEVDAAMLVNAGVLRRAHDGVRLLGDGEIKVKVNFVVYGASKSAIAAVEKAGGSVKVLAPKREAPAEPKGKNAKRLLAEARGEKPKGQPAPAKDDAAKGEVGEKPKGGKAKAEAPAGESKAERPKAEKPKADQQAEKPAPKGDKKPQAQTKGGKGDKGKGAE